MSNPDEFRPPYRAAVVVTVLVFAVYLLTLAPTVTFWDAGEFIAASKILGIPHPPGTPLFVLIAHVWAAIVPIGEYAYRTNMLSALLSAAGAGFFFLVVHESLRVMLRDLPGEQARLLAVGGAAAAAFAGAFTFTNWQNSNETEVYAIATMTIGAIAWLCQVWRRRRGSPAARRILLLIIYLGGVSISNHLLALLSGPAVMAFIWATLRTEPAADPRQRRQEWAELAVVTGIWALLIGSGLGNEALTLIGLLCFVAALVFAATSGALSFGVVALLIAAVGVTPYLYLYIRSGQHPMINEAAPDTWNSLLAVIRRAQYPVRTPLDDPTVLHGPGNPGRSLQIIWLQIQNYVQYFDWQWARGITSRIAAFPVSTFVTLAFLWLGVTGFEAQRRHSRAGWWLCFALFIVTGIGLMAYMNFKPGFSVGYDLYPSGDNHEVRERDYFFVVSFVVWGLWAGMGLTMLVKQLWERRGRYSRPLAGAILMVALVPLVLNWTAASRRHGKDARLAADFAYDLLNTAPPYGILVTYGDNDTFPLWWAQEVEGIRRDVTVICLALSQTDWYMRQLRDNPVRDLDPAQLPAIWRGVPAVRPTWPLHTLSDSQIRQAEIPVQLSEPLSVGFGAFTHVYPAGTVFYPNDLMMIRVMQQNLGRRPIIWSITAGRSFVGLGDRALEQGLGYAILPTPPDTTLPGIATNVIGQWPVDVQRTDSLAWHTYRYAQLLEGDPARLDPSVEVQARALSYPFTVLGFAYAEQGKMDTALASLARAVQLSDDPAIRGAYEQLRARQLQGEIAPGDSTSR
jgi:hypothetical protein